MHRSLWFRDRISRDQLVIQFLLSLARLAATDRGACAYVTLVFDEQINQVLLQFFRGHFASEICNC